MNTGGSLGDVTGILLVGGHGRRMGRDKVLIPFRGRPLVVHVHEALSAVFPSVLVIGHSRPEFKKLRIASHDDLVPQGGVLGGIYTGLCLARTPYVFAAACDMPFLDPILVRQVSSHRHGADAVIPRGPRGPEPLFAVYSRSCLEPFRASLSVGRLRVLDAASELTIASPAIEALGGSNDPFLNINRPEDLDLLKE